MRVNEGIPNGRIAELSNPEMFQYHEEVIVFTQNEFKPLLHSHDEPK